jgi:tetratricopeptide (TPR) repeat protein
MRFRLFTLSLSILLFANTLNATNVEQLKCRFQQLFLVGEMKPWKELVDSLRNETLLPDEDEVLLYGEYGLIGYLIGKGEKKAARIELEKYEKHIAGQLKLYPKSSTLYAFKAASIGFNIWLQPMKAIYLGPSNKGAVDFAVMYHKNEPMPLFEWANSLYFRPSFAGGNKKKATELFNRSLEIYRKNDHCQWMYLNVYTWLGQVYARKGDKETARKIYQSILEEYPNYNWVKLELLPDLEKEKKRFSFLELNL